MLTFREPPNRHHYVLEAPVCALIWINKKPAPAAHLRSDQAGRGTGLLSSSRSKPGIASDPDRVENLPAEQGRDSTRWGGEIEGSHRRWWPRFAFRRRLLIRDGGFSPTNIFIYEAGERLGGAMAMAGEPPTGYILPTSRIFEREFRCTFDLLSLVPSASDPEKSIKEETLAFNERYGFYDKAHIIDRDRNIVGGSHFGLSIRDRLDLVKLALTPEGMLEDRRINEFFVADFFDTEFWFLWAALMGCLPQHSAMEMRRFLHRFLHLLPSFLR